MSDAENGILGYVFDSGRVVPQQRRRGESGEIYEVSGLDNHLCTIQFKDGFLETHPISAIAQDELVLYLWRITRRESSRPDSGDYFDGAVVVAETENAARCIYPDGANGGTYSRFDVVRCRWFHRDSDGRRWDAPHGIWVPPSQVVVKRLGLVENHLDAELRAGSVVLTDLVEG